LTLQTETILSLLEALDWFESLTSEEIGELAEKAVTMRLGPDEVVFEEGAPGDRCFVIYSGSVKVLRGLSDGRRVTLARLGPGQMFGELALFEGDRRSATVQAAEDTVVVGLGADQVGAILRRDAEAAFGMAAMLAQRLRASNERLIESALSTVQGRIAATLLAQVEARQSQGARDRDVEVVGSTADVARLAGAPRDSVSRVLHWLENEGVISMKRGRTVVHDPAALGRYLA
jgi:CRP/FNR family transcriptional regulator, cyclic AMP receptor protein